VLEDLGDGGDVLTDHAGVAVPVHGAFRDRAGVHPVVATSGQQRRPGRGADRGGVKGVVADSVFGYPAECRRADLAADHVGQTKADVVEQHDQNVRGVVR
jgi:hypothetical protein